MMKTIKKAMIFGLLATALSIAQRQTIVVLPTQDLESKLTPQQKDALVADVRDIILKTLSQDEFALKQQSDVERALADAAGDKDNEELGKEELNKSCEEGQCAAAVVQKIKADFGARTDVYNIGKQLHLQFELYGKYKDGKEYQSIGTIPPTPVKDLDEMRAIIRKEVPAIVKRITQSRQERCIEEKGGTWENGECITELQMKQELCRAKEGHKWINNECKSPERLECDLKEKSHVWHAERCKSKEQKECDERHIPHDWDERAGKCVLRVAAPVAQAPTQYAPAARGNFYANIESEPSGAVISLDGAPLYGCTKAPCKDVQFYSNKVNLSAKLDEHETVDTTVSITQPNQIIRIRLRQKTYWAEFSSTPYDVDLVFDDGSQCSTPCRKRLKKGNVSVKASKELYESTSKSFFVSENSRNFDIDLKPNYGTLEISPAYLDGIGRGENWSLRVGGQPFSFGESRLLPGDYFLTLTHSCYEDIKVDDLKIERHGTVYFDMNKHIALKQSTLVLRAKRKGRNISKPVFVNGKQVGETPYEASVPLCSEIKLGKNGEENVPVRLEHNKPVEYTYKDGTSGSHLLGVLLDVAGAYFLYSGLTASKDIDGAYDDYMILKNGERSVYDGAWKKVEDANSTRNTFLIIGGVALTLGIGVHVWF